MDDADPLFQLFRCRWRSRWRRARPLLKPVAKPCHHLFQAERITSLIGVTMDIDEYPGAERAATIFHLLVATMPDT